jgi:predicted transcriptional regulator
MSHQRRGDAPSGSIENVLGPLGAAVMRVAYDEGEVTVTNLLPHLRAMHGREPAYTTVLTILSRLYDRGLLARRKVGRQYFYRPAADEATTMSRLSEAAVSDVLAKYGTAAFRSFAARLGELDPSVRAQLLQLAEEASPE